MRLTEKMGIAYAPKDFTNDRECCDKLGQLEDIEEELGIDLIALFKALKSGNGKLIMPKPRHAKKWH